MTLSKLKLCIVIVIIITIFKLVITEVCSSRTNCPRLTHASVRQTVSDSLCSNAGTSAD